MKKAIPAFALLFCFAVMGCPHDPEVVTVPFPGVRLALDLKIINNSTSAKQITTYRVSVFGDKQTVTAYEGTNIMAPGSSREARYGSDLRYEDGGIMSFAIIVDGKRYAGWKQEDVPEPLQTAERFELGYINVDDPYPALLRTTLTPQERANAGDNSFVDAAHTSYHPTGNAAYYTVTITDDGVDFVLTKVIDDTTPTKPPTAGRQGVLL